MAALATVLSAGSCWSLVATTIDKTQMWQYSRNAGYSNTKMMSFLVDIHWIRHYSFTFFHSVRIHFTCKSNSVVYNSCCRRKRANMLVEETRLLGYIKWPSSLDSWMKNRFSLWLNALEEIPLFPLLIICVSLNHTLFDMLIQYPRSSSFMWAVFWKRSFIWGKRVHSYPMFDFNRDQGLCLNGLLSRLARLFHAWCVTLSDVIFVFLSSSIFFKRLNRGTLVTGGHGDQPPKFLFPPK